MRSVFFTFCYVLFGVLGMMAQSSVRESLAFDSSILGQQVKYSIYLPEDYSVSERSYPVLYLLHGWSDDETSWIQNGNMKRIVDESIASGKAVDMIVVMPDGGKTWYVDAADGKCSYEEMFFKELIPYIEKTYRARTDRQNRAISGVSMGGYGTLLYAMHHPELFSACAPMSAAMYTDEECQSFTGEWKEVFTRLFGLDKSLDYWHQNNILRMVEKMDKVQLSHMCIYMDCGDKDNLLDQNYQLHKLMTSKGIRHEFRVRGGYHGWTYWRGTLPTVLELVSIKFKKG